MDPIDPIRPLSPIWSPLEVLHPYDLPLHHLPHPHPGKQQSPPQDEEPQPEFPQPQPLLPPAPAKDLKHVLLDAGVRGIGPVGWGYELSQRELTDALREAYRSIGRSAYHAIADHHELVQQIASALAADSRGAGEMGLMLLLNDRLAVSLANLLSPGLTNRWQHAGERLLKLIDGAPKSVIADLLLVEPPGHHYVP